MNMNMQYKTSLLTLTRIWQTSNIQPIFIILFLLHGLKAATSGYIVLGLSALHQCPLLKPFVFCFVHGINCGVPQDTPTTLGSLSWKVIIQLAIASLPVACSLFQLVNKFSIKLQEKFGLNKNAKCSVRLPQNYFNYDIGILGMVAFLSIPDLSVWMIQLHISVVLQHLISQKLWSQFGSQVT